MMEIRNELWQMKHQKPTLCSKPELNQMSAMFHDFVASYLFCCFLDRATVLENYDTFWTGVTLKLTANTEIADRGEPPTTVRV